MSSFEGLPQRIQTPLLSPTAPPMSIAGAQAVVPTWTDITPRQSRDMISALANVARWLGRPPGDLILIPTVLRDGFLNKSPAAFRIAPSRKSNVKTLIGSVMHRLGLIDEPPMELPNRWTELLAALTPHEQINAKRFARFCAARGQQPDDVRPETFADFEWHLEFRTLTPRPKKLAAEVRAQWNKCVATVPGWPQMVVTKAKDHRHFYHPLTAFPSSFQESIADFRRHLSASSLDNLYRELPADEEEDDQAPLPSGRPLAASTIANRIDHARWAASALVASGVPIEDITDVRVLVSPIQNAQRILRFLHERAGGNPSAAGQHCADVLRIIARYYARSPQADVEKIKRWGKTVQLRYDGMTAKNKRTVRAVLVPAVEAKLIALPDSLMTAARKLRLKSPQLAWSLAMRALAAEFLTRVPVRLENLIELRLDKHLSRASASSTQYSHADWDEDEVKNALALSFPLSSHTRALLNEWVKVFRPIMAQPGCPFLFPGQSTTAKHITPQGLRDAVKKVTLDHLGVTITPHQFRHIAAARYLSEFPGEIEVVRQFLGHKNIQTTIGTYADYLNDAAIARYDTVLTNRLQSLGTTQPKPSGGR